MKQTTRLDRLEAEQGEAIKLPEIIFLSAPVLDVGKRRKVEECFSAYLVVKDWGTQQIGRYDLESNEAFQQRAQETLERMKRERDDAA